RRRGHRRPDVEGAGRIDRRGVWVLLALRRRRLGCHVLHDLPAQVIRAARRDVLLVVALALGATAVLVLLLDRPADGKDDPLARRRAEAAERRPLARRPRRRGRVVPRQLRAVPQRVRRGWRAELRPGRAVALTGTAGGDWRRGAIRSEPDAGLR